MSSAATRDKALVDTMALLSVERDKADDEMKIILLKRLNHFLFGHPRKEVRWGNVLEGARCKCGQFSIYGIFTDEKLQR